MSIINVISQSYPSFLAALLETVKMTILTLVFATLLGTIIGLLSISKIKPLKFITTLYIDIIRGTPLLVQIFVVYYGVAQAFKPMGFSWNPIGGAFTAGVVTLTLNAGAYMAEIVRGGIESVDKGQMEAARSLGLPYGRSMLKIILPQAFRTMLPSIINQFIITLKDTSLISVIGIRELTYNGKVLAANAVTMVMAIWLTVALFYLIPCTILSKSAKVIEKKVAYGK